MTEIRRWLDSDQAQPEVLELLAAARPPSPLDYRTRARSRRRVAALTTLPAAAGAMLWFKSVALGALLGGAATASVLVPKWRSNPVVEAPVAPDESRPTRRQPSQPGTAPAQEVQLLASAAPIAQLPQPPVNLANPNVTPPAPTPSATNELTREIQLLERSRQLLGVNPSLALETLAQHQREFGTGVLVLEREFLLVEALWRMGRGAEARSRAAALRRRAPHSLYERRLHQLLGDPVGISRFEDDDNGP